MQIFASAELAKDSYTGRGNTGLGVLVENKETRTECYVRRQNGRTLLIFPGTIDLHDWFTNVKFGLVDCGLVVKAHRGGKEALDSILPQLREHIPKEGKLGMIGHSLGGMLATLAAYEFRGRTDFLHTFGSPRPGNVALKQTLEMTIPEIKRVVNNNDLVTRVPTRRMGYSHVGRCHYFDSGGKLHVGPSPWKVFLDRLKGKWDDLGSWGLDYVKDHNMGKIYNLCKKAGV